MKKLILGITVILAAAGLGFAHHSAAVTPLADDLNNDGVVNIFDLSIFLSHYHQTGSLPEDYNGDGVVDQADLNIFLANYPGHTSDKDQPAPVTSAPVTSPVTPAVQPTVATDLVPASVMGFSGK